MLLAVLAAADAQTGRTAPPAPATAAQGHRPAPGTIVKDCPSCPELVPLPTGTFLMGSAPDDPDAHADEMPRHSVTISRRLAVGRFEVSREEFGALMEPIPPGREISNRCRVLAPFSLTDSPWTDLEYNPGAEGSIDRSPKAPMVCVSRDDAQRYIDRLSEKTGRKYRLLSEAEWEYAARAGRGPGRFPWGEDPDGRQACSHANLADRSAKAGPLRWIGLPAAPCDDGHAFMATADSGRPNAFGLHHMHGNVWEWVQDVWYPSHDGAPTDGSARTVIVQPFSGHVIRGGSWASLPHDLRSARRSWHASSKSTSTIGFRVVRELADDERVSAAPEKASAQPPRRPASR